MMLRIETEIYACKGQGVEAVIWVSPVGEKTFGLNRIFPTIQEARSWFELRGVGSVFDAETFFYYLSSKLSSARLFDLKLQSSIDGLIVNNTVVREGVNHY